MNRLRQGGFTFVEILLALLVGAIVVVGMYQAFNILHKNWIAIGVTSEQRQSARAGLETVTRDLEMAGYQTTNYGDSNKTGIAITLAGTHEIEVDQQRPDNATLSSATPVYVPRLVYYHLATDMKTGRQNLYRQIRTQPRLPSPDEIVAENISVFSLAYYTKDNQPVPGLPPATAAGSAAYTAGAAVPANSPLRAIRRIEVTLTTVPARSLPTGPQGTGFTLKASVIPQNLESADEATADVTPPAVPSGLTVIDTCSCSEKLRVKWTRNTEPDRAGYILFYGTTGSFPVPVRALLDKNNPEFPLNPRDLAITKYAVRNSAPNTYAVQIAAYDSSGNTSAKSAAVYANPSPDIRAFGGADDTTVNPCKPSPPTGLAVVPGAADGELVVSWQAPADGSATVGFRLYRSTAPFVDGHVDGALQIAGEADLAAGATNWTDRNLEGCRTYYYAVASVNCDETLVAIYSYNSTNATASDYAVASGAPRDSGHPPAPSLAGSAPDVQRAFISLSTPVAAACPDCDRTEIYWSRSGTAPHLEGTVVLDGTLLPDREDTTGSPGVFRKQGDQVVVFDSETEAEPSRPSLVCGATYDVLAVTYDRCNNVSLPATAAEPALAIRCPSDCVDDPAGPPPDAFGNPTIVSCQPDRVDLGWLYPVSAVADFAGFRIDRVGPDRMAVPLTAGPTLRTSWTDASVLTPGSSYTYEVTATDCAWEQSLLLDPVVPPYAEPLNTLTLGPIFPGVLQPYRPRIAGAVAHAASSVSAGAGTIPITPPASGWSFADSGQLSIGCYRVAYTGVSFSGTNPAAFTGCTWPAAAQGYTASANTPLYQYTWSAYAAPENFVTSISDASRPYSYHNNVKFYLQNTSTASMMIKKMAVAWDNPGVVLESVTVGGSPSSSTSRTIASAGVGAGVSSGTAFTVGVEILDHATGVGSPSGAIPVVLRFTNPDGSVSRLTDMRSETLNVSLWGWNPSFENAECSIPVTYSLAVPRGPVLGGFSQSAPGVYGIDSYEVVGPSGSARDTDVKVPYGIDVNVYGTVFDNSADIAPDLCAMGFASGYPEVYGTSAAAAAPTAAPAMPNTGTFFHRPLQSVGGDRYAIFVTDPAAAGALMPQVSDKVVWYSAIAVDATGNWDRVPDPDAGSYAYFQPPFDVCSVAPRAPELRLISSSTSQANLAWTAPTHYENGLAIDASDPLAYDVYTKTAGGDPWPSVPLSVSQAGLTYSHNADLLAGSYYYMVRAKNSCDAGPRVSADSNVVKECEGPASIDCSLFTVPATAKYGEPLTFTISDFCAYRGNGPGDTLVFRVVSGSTTTNFTTAETEDTGNFAKTVTPVWSGSGTDVVVAPSGSLSVTLVLGGATPCAAKTVTLTGAACFTTPNPPTLPTNPTQFAVVNNGNVVLTWFRPNFNVGGSALDDLAGYQIDSAQCTDWNNSGLGNCRSWASWVTIDLDDPAAQAHTISGLTPARYKFRVRAKDSCATPNLSEWTSESSTVRVR